ncbi:MAG: DUF416 family protein [Anaerolineaceae bacterium]
MPTPTIKTLDDYEMYLGETIEAWSSEQRLALAAAIAERWLPAYDDFSKNEEWGDSPSLHFCLDTVWRFLLGETQLTAGDRARYKGQIQEVTPHMDDFDANEALAACIILSEAVECCRMGDNTRFAIQAALSGFEAVAPDWAMDPDEQPHLWQMTVVRKELRKQLKLVEQIGGITVFNETIIKTLRSGLTQPGMACEAPPKDTAHETSLLSNQAAFDHYRRMIESDLRGKDPTGADFKPQAIIFNTMLFSEWSSRYRRRRDTINGYYGKLADTKGIAALIAWEMDRDGRITEVPNWDKELRWMIDLIMKNPMNGLDVNSAEQPHGHGPSLRSLWVEAKQTGYSDDNAHLAIIAWARHRPDAWQEADERKKKGRLVEDSLGQRLNHKVSWSGTHDTANPWKADVDGESWLVGINDFPDDYLYTLYVNNSQVGKFHDWPETWVRD